MELCFDVFKLNNMGGQLTWVGAAVSVGGAKAIASGVHAGEPVCDFVVLDHRTGARQMILHTELALTRRVNSAGAS